MIQPQVHTGTPGTIGQQHGLQRLTETLEALTKGHAVQQQCNTQIQTQLTTQAAALTQLTLGLRWQRWALAGLVLLLSGLVGWQVTHPPEMTYARALGAVDGVVVQQWGSLPKGAQEAFTTTYGRLGLVAPGQRK